MTDNGVGVTFTGSMASNNIFYSNSFENDQNVQITSTNYAEIWDNCTVGNYWSDYNGTDTDGDSLGDTPYVIDEKNQDNYPLIEPIEIDVIPEFPSWAILPLFLSATFSVIIIRKN